jgi:hypothetical protein
MKQQFNRNAKKIIRALQPNIRQTTILPCVDAINYFATI